MFILTIVTHLNGIATWTKDLRFALCAVVGLAMVIRIGLMWMSTRDKRQALEETLWWVGALIFLAIAPDLIDEIFDLFAAR
ncbi:MAG: hypothetical protein AAFQ08_02535, partial [Bacteroidota bacterium]